MNSASKYDSDHSDSECGAKPSPLTFNIHTLARMARTILKLLLAIWLLAAFVRATEVRLVANFPLKNNFSLHFPYG